MYSTRNEQLFRVLKHSNLDFFVHEAQKPDRCAPEFGDNSAPLQTLLKHLFPLTDPTPIVKRYIKTLWEVGLEPTPTDVDCDLHPAPWTARSSWLTYSRAPQVRDQTLAEKRISIVTPERSKQLWNGGKILPDYATLRSIRRRCENRNSPTHAQTISCLRIREIPGSNLDYSITEDVCATCYLSRQAKAEIGPQITPRPLPSSKSFFTYH